MKAGFLCGLVSWLYDTGVNLSLLINLVDYFCWTNLTSAPG